MPSDHGFPDDVVAKGQAILMDKTTSIGEVKDAFLAYMWELKLPTQSVLHTNDLLTHPKNRGSLLLNPNNAHRNGSLIRRVGANLAELHNAVSMEMSPDPVVRAERLRAPLCMCDSAFQCNKTCSQGFCMLAHLVDPFVHMCCKPQEQVECNRKVIKASAGPGWRQSMAANAT